MLQMLPHRAADARWHWDFCFMFAGMRLWGLFSFLSALAFSVGPSLVLASEPSQVGVDQMQRRAALRAVLRTPIMTPKQVSAPGRHDPAKPVLSDSERARLRQFLAQQYRAVVSRRP